MSNFNVKTCAKEEISRMYYQVKSDLKNISSSTSAKSNDEEIIDRINYDLLMNMFEVYKESSQRNMESLIEENNVKDLFYFRNCEKN